jgi:hypothetical protein
MGLKISFSLFYEDIFVMINIDSRCENKEDALTLVNSSHSYFHLIDDAMIICLDGSLFAIHSNDNELYSISVNTKKMPDPIDVTSLSDEEKLALLSNDRWVINDSDLLKVDFSICKLYEVLQKFSPNTNCFDFSCLSCEIFF